MNNWGFAMFLPHFYANLLWYHWLIIVVGALLASSILFSIWLVFAISRRVYLHTLSKKMDNDWGRVCSAPNNPEQMKMWNGGIEYMKQFENKKHDLTIKHDGLKLCAEFYDLGGKKTAVFLCGRCECLMYGYFYAKPYVESGLNVLFIDQRAHGYSEGVLSTVGIKESEDVVAWMKYVKETFKQESFILHCVCVGGSSGLLACISENNKNYVEKVILDGVFINFQESYRRHYIDLGHKPFPVLYLVWFWFRVYTGVSVKRSSPYDCVEKIDVPLLFIHTRNDKYSLPENAEKVFEHAKTEKKKLVWFDEGTHSHIRNNATEKYDATIKDFLTTY